MGRKISDQKAEEILNKKTKKVKEEDFKRVIDKADEIEKKFRANGPLGRFISDFKILISLVRDYIKGVYREIPWWTIAAIVASLLYVLNPIDLIPDFIPIIGYIDDAAVIAACLRMIEEDLHKYKEWKKKNA